MQKAEMEELLTKAKELLKDIPDEKLHRGKWWNIWSMVYPGLWKDISGS